MDVMIESLASRALAAWSVVRPASVESARIDVLKGRKERKIVCRLAGAAPSGAHVIAKRYRLSTGRVERAIYDHILPFLPVPALLCYGLVEEENGTRCWLFLEDAGGMPYSTSVEEHRRLAGRWLGLLHVSAPRARALELPDRSPAHYRQCLEQGRATIIAGRGNPALTTDHASMLEALLHQLDLLEARWPEIEELCAAMPETLVHGDFVPKNLRVRESETGGESALLCFEWGCAGWGNPAADLAQAPATARRLAASPDLDAYWSVVRDHWPACSLAAVHRWASVGNVFRALTSLSWASRSLASAWVEDPVAELRVALEVIAHDAPVALMPVRPDEDALRRCVEEIVAKGRGVEAAILGVERRPLDQGSSHAVAIVSVRLGQGAGEKLQLLLKDFGGTSRYAKDEPSRQAEREMRVYRDILAYSNLGTATLHGACWDDEASMSRGEGRRWLVLEHVPGTPLAYHGYDDAWMAAARWLARLHAYAERHDDAVRKLSELLLRHDAAFFWSTAHRALTEVASISRALADRLATLLHRYDSFVALMADQPLTLVHGAFKPRHILVDDTVAPRRICPLDWELAATGSALYDLAFLAYGLRDVIVDQLLAAYRLEALAQDLPPLVPLGHYARLRQLVDCFRVHRVLKALGRTQERGLTNDRVAKLTASAERLADAATAVARSGAGR